MIGSAGPDRSSSLDEDALLASALLGGGLPPEAEHHLWEAGLSYHLDDVAEMHLKEAQLLAPGHAAVLIGLYRFYFYKGRLAEALEVARVCLAKAAREICSPPTGVACSVEMSTSVASTPCCRGSTCSR